MATSPTPQNVQSVESPDEAIKKVAAERGINPSFLLGLARLETAGGSKTIKGGGVDTRNLFNIKDFAGGGIAAFDKAEKSRDKYRAYASYEESATDLLGLLERKYPNALTAKTGAEFATALKAGGYATDPEYVSKLTRVIGDGSVAAAVPDGPTGQVETADGFVQRVQGQSRAAAVGRQIEFATVEPGRQQAAAMQAADVEQQRISDETGILDVAGAALQHPAYQPTLAVLRAIENADEDRTLPEGWDNASVIDRLESQHYSNPNAVDFIRENVRGPESARRVEAELVVRAELEEVMGRGGTTTQVLGTLLGGMADPGSMLVGIGFMKGAQALKIGSGAMIAQGRGGAAVASSVLENVAGNLAVEAAADMSGEVYSTSDYVVAAATAAGLSGVFARGTLRQAAEKRTADTFDKLRADELARHKALVDQATAELGEGATIKDVQARVDKIEADERAEVERVHSRTDGDRLVPDEVLNEQRREFEGLDDEPPAPPPARDPEELPEPAKPTTPIEDAESLGSLGKGEQSKPVVRDILDADGEAVNMEWQIGKTPTVNGATVQDVTAVLLADPTARKNLGEATVAILERIQKTAVAWQGALPVEFRFRKGTSYYHQLGRVKSPTGVEEFPTAGVVIKTGDTGSLPSMLKGDGAKTKRAFGSKPLDVLVSKFTQRGVEVLAHEITHAVTHAQVAAVQRGVDTRPAMVANVAKLEEIRGLLEAHIRDSKGKLKPGFWDGGGAGYATKDIHELLAQVSMDKQTRAALAEIDMPGGRSALSKFVQTVAKLLGVDKSQRTALDETLSTLDKIVRAGRQPDGKRLYAAEDVMNLAPDVPGVLPAPSSANPDRAASARARWIPQMYARAAVLVKQLPTDYKARLDVATKWVEGGFSDGLKMLTEKNDVMQAFVAKVLETTTGAGGTGPKVAIDRQLRLQKYIGNAVWRGEKAYEGWVRSVKQQGFMSQVVNDTWGGSNRREFNAAVMEELRARERGTGPVTTDKFVLEAANELGEGFERMRVDQLDAGTLGSANLGGLDGRKYVPQALEGRKLATLDSDQMGQLAELLAPQLQRIVPLWDAKFTDLFAKHYLKRARDRAMQGAGDRNAQQATDGLSAIREALDDMGGDADAIKKAKQALQTRSGLGHTKHKISWDMDARLPWGGKLGDLFNNDPFTLFRSYANRTAGNVALTRAGILGEKGLIEIREALQSSPPGQQVSEQGMEAFDRVAAELLGRPVPGAVIGEAPNALRMLVSLQRLGGLPFTQAAETVNGVHHLGLGAVLKGIADFPRHWGNVGRVKRGQADQGILGSIETVGGAEFGADNYKMVMPFDPPDDRLMVYGDKQGWFNKMLGAGVHLQSKISLFRGLMAAQQRAMAEQTTIKALRYIRDGKSDQMLEQAGFSPDLMKRVRPFMDQIAKWDGDRLVSLDMTKLPDVAAAEQFVQSVWRMNAQIIQGTFIGERSKWFHNDYMKMFIQLRTFGLTAQEKQFGRNRLNHGYGVAAGIIMGQILAGSLIHLARVQLNASLRGDREEYLKDNASVGALIKAGMNYSSATGLLGEAYQYATAIGGGYIDDAEVKRQLGVRSQSTSVGGLIPAFGSVDALLKVASGKTNAYHAAKQLPFSNLWYVNPFLGAMKE